jgi:hypothetical protein
MNEIRSKQEERIAKKGERNETSNVKLCFKSDPEIIDTFYRLISKQSVSFDGC